MGQVAEKQTDQQPSLAGLTDSLGFLLRMAQLKVFEQFFKTLGRFELRPGEFSVLVVIAQNPGVRQGLLANALNIKPAHMTKMVRNFETRNLILRAVPEDDRRAVELSLSKEGERHVTELAPHFYDFDRAQCEPLTRAEMETLRGLLRKFNGFPERPTAKLFDLGGGK